MGSRLLAHRSFTYGTPMARGATARPTKPASRPTVRTYGMAWMSWTGTTPTTRQRRALEPRLDGVGEGEEEAGQHGRHRAPLPEDQGGQGEIALARRHVPDERRVMGDRQIRARTARRGRRSRSRPGSASAPPRRPRCRRRPGSRPPRAAGGRTASGTRATPPRARRSPRDRRARCDRSRPHCRSGRCPEWVRAAAAPGRAMGPKRAPPPRSGVWPPSRNQAKPSTAVSPDTVMLSAMPETTWLP